jgi:hypothetical protein
MTMREMCERIATELERRTGEPIEPRRIFEMDPRGELWPVYALYQQLFGLPPGGAVSVATE